MYALRISNSIWAVTAIVILAGLCRAAGLL